MDKLCAVFLYKDRPIDIKINVWILIKICARCLTAGVEQASDFYSPLPFWDDIEIWDDRSILLDAYVIRVF